MITNQSKNTDQIRKEIRIAHLMDLIINPVLNAIEFESVTHAVATLKSLTTELAIFQIAANPLDPENKIRILHELKELYLNAAENTSKEENLQEADLQLAITNRIEEYIKEMQNHDMKALTALIESQQQERNKAIASKATASTMLIFSSAKDRRTANSSKTDQSFMSKYAIHNETKRSEAYLCVDILDLIKKINGLQIKFCLYARDMEKQQRGVSDAEVAEIRGYLSKISSTFTYILENWLHYSDEFIDAFKAMGSIPYSEINHIKWILLNLLARFERSFMTLEQFIPLSDPAKNYLIENAVAATEIMCTTDQAEFGLCVHLLGLAHKIRLILESNPQQSTGYESLDVEYQTFEQQEISAMSADEKTEEITCCIADGIALINTEIELQLDAQHHDTSKALKYFENAVVLFAHNSFSLQRFKQFDPATKLGLLQDPKPVVDLIRNLGMESAEFERHSYSFFKSLSNNKNYNALVDLLKKCNDSNKYDKKAAACNVNINKLLQLPDHTVLTMIGQTNAISIFCRGANISINNFLNMAQDKIVFLFSNSVNLSKIGSEILTMSLEQLQQFRVTKTPVAGGERPTPHRF